MASLQSLTDGIGARGVGYPGSLIVVYFTPKACCVFLFAVDVGDEVVDTSVIDQYSDVVIVYRSREHIAQIFVDLCGGLRAERLIAKVGIGMNEECALLGIELGAHQFAGANVNVGRLIGAEILFETLLDNFLLRLCRYACQSKKAQQEGCQYPCFHESLHSK